MAWRGLGGAFTLTRAELRADAERDAQRLLLRNRFVSLTVKPDSSSRTQFHRLLSSLLRLEQTARLRRGGFHSRHPDWHHAPLPCGARHGAACGVGSPECCPRRGWGGGRRRPHLHPPPSARLLFLPPGVPNIKREDQGPQHPANHRARGAGGGAKQRVILDPGLVLSQVGGLFSQIKDSRYKRNRGPPGVLKAGQGRLQQSLHVLSTD